MLFSTEGCFKALDFTYCESNRIVRIAVVTCSFVQFMHHNTFNHKLLIKCQLKTKAPREISVYKFLIMSDTHIFKCGKYICIRKYEASKFQASG